MATRTGSHLCGFHGLLTRMPMRKTTKSPSMRATWRPGKTGMTASLTVQGGHPQCLLAQGTGRRAVQALEGLDGDAAAVVAPGAGDGAVDEEGRYRLGHLRVEHARAVALGEDVGAAGVDEQHRVPCPEQAHGRGRVR